MYLTWYNRYRFQNCNWEVSNFKFVIIYYDKLSVYYLTASKHTDQSKERMMVSVSCLLQLALKQKHEATYKFAKKMYINK
jgi:hypothetical protein